MTRKLNGQYIASRRDRESYDLDARELGLRAAQALTTEERSRTASAIATLLKLRLEGSWSW